MMYSFLFLFWCLGESKNHSETWKQWMAHENEMWRAVALNAVQRLTWILLWCVVWMGKEEKLRLDEHRHTERAESELTHFRTDGSTHHVRTHIFAYLKSIDTTMLWHIELKLAICTYIYWYRYGDAREYTRTTALDICHIGAFISIFKMDESTVSVNIFIARVCVCSCVHVALFLTFSMRCLSHSIISTTHICGRPPYLPNVTH